MNIPHRHEAAARHLPVAHQRNASRAKGEGEQRHTAERRLQVAVNRRPALRDERDPYADVPCTD
jgi:hypothetical protein